MASKKRLIDYDEVRKLFDEEFKKTMQLIQDGETHLDNLAEGFSEADKVLWKLVVLNPLTNADIIRSMSDEELAAFLTSETKRLVHHVFEFFNVEFPEMVIYNNRLQWLQQPAEECE